MSKTGISQRLGQGQDRGTIYHELNRNTGQCGYRSKVVGSPAPVVSAFREQHEVVTALLEQ